MAANELIWPSLRLPAVCGFVSLCDCVSSSSLSALAPSSLPAHKSCRPKPKGGPEG